MDGSGRPHQAVRRGALSLRHSRKEGWFGIAPFRLFLGGIEMGKRVRRAVTGPP
jgi:hypothetical protein